MHATTDIQQELSGLNHCHTPPWPKNSSSQDLPNEGTSACVHINLSFSVFFPNNGFLVLLSLDISSNSRLASTLISSNYFFRVWYCGHKSILVSNFSKCSSIFQAQASRNRGTLKTLATKLLTQNTQEKLNKKNRTLISKFNQALNKYADKNFEIL